MSRLRVLTNLLSLFVLFLVGCGGGQLAANGITADDLPGAPVQNANLSMRVNVGPQVLGRFEQPGDAIELLIDILDPQTQSPVVDPRTVDLRQPGEQVVSFPGVPVGIRDIRFRGVPVGGAPLEDGAPVFCFEDQFQIVVALDETPVYQFEIENGNVEFLNPPITPIGAAGVVQPFADIDGQAESQPDITMVGLRYAVTFRRQLDTTNSIIIADLFQGESTDFTQQPTDLDGIPFGFEVNQPGISNRSNPRIAMDQRGDFTVGWLDNSGPNPLLQGRSYDAEGQPVTPEVADLTITAFAGANPSRFELDSTTNPVIQDNAGFGGEVRHFFYINDDGADRDLAYRTSPPDALNCDPIAFCPPGSDLIDCACFISDFLFGTAADPDVETEIDPPPPVQVDSNIGMDVAQDGFASLLVYEDNNHVYTVYSRPWLGTAFENTGTFQVTEAAGNPGEVDAAFLGFSFTEAFDESVVVFELDGQIFFRTYQTSFGDFLEAGAAPVLVGQGTQPRVVAASATQFYVVWVTPAGEIMLDLFNYVDGSRESIDPPHLVSDSSVVAGTSNNPSIASGSFGTVVVWEGQTASGDRGIFEKRFSANFIP